MTCPDYLAPTRCVAHLRGNWARGYKTYRQGRAVGFIAPLDHLAVREISAATCLRTSALRSPACAAPA